LISPDIWRVDGIRQNIRSQTTRNSTRYRVGVLNADTVSTTMRLHDVHHRIVCIFRRPIALPLEHHHEPGDGLGTGLAHALHGVLM